MALIPPGGTSLVSIIKKLRPNIFIPKATMIFDIDDIPDLGLDLDLTVQRARFEWSHSYCSLSQDVNVSGNLTKLGKEIYLKGQVKTAVELNCSRCLKPFNRLIDTTLTARFIPKPKQEAWDHDRELHEEDVETEYYSEHKLDISNPVHDAILLDIPMNALCKEDCLGLCSLCGQDLNTGLCQCEKEQPIDPRLEVLKTLKDKIK